MSPYLLDPVAAAAWQESWDRQQEYYMPDREERYAAMLDAVAGVSAGRAPRVLDLAGGTGSISLRVLGRWPDAEVTLLDIDPVLLTIARSSLRGRATVTDANLAAPDWAAALPHREYDAVLTATALHWFPLERLEPLYAEIRDVLRPGGVFLNVDHMADPGLPTFTERVREPHRARREAREAAGAVMSWTAWWEHVAKDPALGPILPERAKVFEGKHSTESDPPVTWHLDTLRAAGYSEVGLHWRGGVDAMIAGVR